MNKKKERAIAIYKALEKKYPDARCSLDYETPFQLLVATQLAAQCTDKRVNMVTPRVFEKCPTPLALSLLGLEEIEDLIRSTGFFRNKARNLKLCAEQLVKNFDGEVPKDMEKLLMLPGVGRKTANVIRGEAYGLPGIVVDTHAGRISRRLGLTKAEDPKKVEFDLMELLPEEKWMKFCHLLIELGRDVCTSRKAHCRECVLKDICSFSKKA